MLPKEFLVNLADDRFAKLQVALDRGAPAGRRRAATAPPTPPEGYGAEPQEAVIRDIITNELTDATDRELIGHEGREKIKKRILESIKKHTDVHVEEVLFPDVTVQ